MDNETFTIRQASQELGIPVYTVRYFCNHGLIPNVRRGRGARRVFTREQFNWIKTLHELRECGFKIKELKKYTRLCREGDATIPERKAMLATRRHQLRQEAARISHAADFIEGREELFEAILDGKNPEHDEWL